MKSIKIEEIYLMNVSFYLHTYRDVYRFIQINKKCLNVISRLNVNPYFKNIQSLTSYMKRFSPQTIKCGNAGRGKSHGFSRVVAGTWVIFSSYSGNSIRNSSLFIEVRNLSRYEGQLRNIN